MVDVDRVIGWLMLLEYGIAGSAVASAKPTSPGRRAGAKISMMAKMRAMRFVMACVRALCPVGMVLPA